ncbi:hypothetical protein TOPH_03863 [Tolypocladium ophioglossoides CBS 100239]|uniref:Uncharacterized protein n=1 Tax=Tolypocladium ophioglossoides (strain CBS 100239) TaxID=1163406 RepID=A0A0L0NBW0_TOLOC|nr:hypothetical protein TOPH_03863 [Tolypocladium ophioglossoides CBS 100239]
MDSLESTSTWPTPNSATTEVQPSFALEARPKLEAEADAHVYSYHPSPPSCRPQQDHASISNRRTSLHTLPDASFNAPEAKSIHAIMRQHCRSRLYVHPLFWTAEHLKLLGCEFVSKKVPRNKRQKTLIPTELHVSDDATADVKNGWAVRAAKRLCQPCPLAARISAIGELLAGCNIVNLESPTLLSFCFDRRVVKVATDGIFGSEPATPSLAYINLDKVHSFRGKCLRRRFVGRRRENAPVARLIRKKLCHLKPEKEAEDPYIVAALIALAYQQYQQQQQPRNNASVSVTHDEAATVQSTVGTTITIPSGEKDKSISRPFEVRLLAVPGIAARELHLYAARIPPGFLNKFDRPSKFSPSEPISIVYYSLPLGNAEKLPKRLRRALRTPVE